MKLRFYLQMQVDANVMYFNLPASTIIMFLQIQFYEFKDCLY